ncbi:hypothetical protein [Microcella indica]|uniref:hypothetical protein n=1 Tax=Microcella indica TaxID=2750620 RepID=UPI0015CF2983|nr:hypothetical protein [Microcella indica]
MTTSRIIILSALALASATALTGCAIADSLQNEKASEFSSTADLVADWEKSAPWLPEDATGIRIRETPDAAPATLLATSSTALDPAVCIETERLSGPTFALDGAPSPYTDSAFACGEWTVIPTDDGWYGWTPNHPDERAAAENLD